MSSKSPGISKYWQSLLLVLGPALLGIALVYFIARPQAEQSAAEQNVRSVAEVKAGALDNALQVLSGQLEGLSRLSQLRSAIAAGEQGTLDIMASEWSLMFSNINQLAILPMGELGTADLGVNRRKLRNNIEKDIVERARGDERVVIDVYQLDGRYVVSLARAVKSGTRSVGAILLTLKADWLLAQLESFESDSGATTQSATQLFYSVAGSQPTLVVTQGNTSAATQPLASARVPLRFNANLSLAYSVMQAPAVLASAMPALIVTFSICAVLGIIALLRQIGVTHNLVGRDANSLTDFIGSAFDKESAAAPDFGFAGFASAASGFSGALARYRKKRSKASVKPAEPMQVVTDSEEGTSWENPMFANKIEVEEPEEALETEAQAGGALEIPAHIFRAYDIRGIADTELDDATVAAIGKALGSAALDAGNDRLVLARDGRLSSERIHEMLQNSVLSTGCDVIDIGLVPTPLMYFATEHLHTGAGIMVTGSHNGPEYNGMKVVLESKSLVDEQVQDIYRRAAAGSFLQGAGDLTRQDIVDSYIDQIADDVVFASQLKVVLDCGNGAASEIAPMLFASLGCEVVPLFAEVDGNFPNHLPDPGKPENLRALVDEVSAQQADLGIAFDGDADRMVAVTASGRIVDADILLMLFARDVLTRNPGADVVYDVKCTRNLSQVISNHGGRPVMWQSGHSRIKHKMLETGALLGGEYSGHFFFKERWFGFDDGLYSGTRLIEMLTLEGCSLDEALQELPESFCSPELDIPVEEGSKFELVEQLAGSVLLGDGEVSRLDGVRVDYPEGWGLVRASNTAPKLTARFEADSEQALSEIRQRFSSALGQLDPELKIPA
ncbi:MAG: phosphomannomutase/phosphoglucomutase [Pseudomonadales bacterium]|nr:phosphomannomutase/phosphoglucomutase [Pseudomonadales bacterium]